MEFFIYEALRADIIVIKTESLKTQRNGIIIRDIIYYLALSILNFFGKFTENFNEQIMAYKAI